MGGYVTRYVNDFDFVTIRGAGHMVPEYKPEAAFVMTHGWYTLTETNSSPLKMDGWNTTFFPIGMAYFQVLC